MNNSVIDEVRAIDPCPGASSGWSTSDEGRNALAAVLGGGAVVRLWPKARRKAPALAVGAAVIVLAAVGTLTALRDRHTGQRVNTRASSPETPPTAPVKGPDEGGTSAPNPSVTTSSQAVRSGIIYLKEDQTTAIQQGSTTYDVPDSFALPDGTRTSTKKVTDVSADQSSKNVFALTVSEENDSCAPHLIKWDAAGGNATYLGEGFLPEFSPDGKFVLYIGRARTDTKECAQTGLILADASTGSIVRRWTTTTEQNDIIQSRPQWAPDGTQVAVSLTSSELAILPVVPAGSDMSLREAARLYDSPTHGLQRPVWLSNGLYVLLVGPDATYLKAFDPSNGKYGQNLIKDPVGDVIAADPKGNLLIFQGEKSGYPSGRVFFYSGANQVLSPLDPRAGNPVDLTDW